LHIDWCLTSTLSVFQLYRGEPIIWLYNKLLKCAFIFFLPTFHKLVFPASYVLVYVIFSEIRMHSFPLIFLWFIYHVSNNKKVWNNTHRYEILHTLNLGCYFITLKEPYNNQRPRCDIAWLHITNHLYHGSIVSPLNSEHRSMNITCSFCWYWWNCWSLLFKLSIHKDSF
jgi:hypothetical protein